MYQPIAQRAHKPCEKTSVPDAFSPSLVSPPESYNHSLRRCAAICAHASHFSCTNDQSIANVGRCRTYVGHRTTRATGIDMA